MNLYELVNQHPVTPEKSVPTWMLGCFRRRCISFANGESDNTTTVYWFQSRNFTIDLRLPKTSERVRAKPLSHYGKQELQVLANYEGWVADSVWDGNLLSWHGGTSLQTTNRWPEPAELRRIGNCMIEFAPSSAYVEDWRAQPSVPGPLIGLQLIKEYCPDTGVVYHQGGGLIVCGDHAALVLGRGQEPNLSKGDFVEQVSDAEADPHALHALLGFETSVAQGTPTASYTVTHSTRPERVGQPLLSLQGFTWLGNNQVRQVFDCGGQRRERLFRVDTIEPNTSFAMNTDTSASANAWFTREAATLARYLEVLT